MTGRFQIAIHILTILGRLNEEVVSSEFIGGSINANPALIRKELSNLRNHNLIKSKEGKNGGYSLNIPPQNIKLSEVYLSVKQQSVLGIAKNMPNPQCPVGKQISTHLYKLDKEMEKTMLEKLGSMTLAEFSSQFN